MPRHGEREFDSTNKSSVEQLSTVLAIIQSINSVNLDLDQTFSMVVEKVRSLLNYPLVSLFLLDESGDQAELEAFSFKDVTQLIEDRNVYALQPRSPISVCRRKGKPIVSKKISVFPNDPRESLVQGILASAVFPLSSVNGIFGILEVCSEKSYSFSDVEMENLLLLSSHCSTSLQNCLQFNAVQKKLENYQEIQRSSYSIDQQPSTEEIIRQTVQILTKLIPGSRVSFLAPETSGHLRVKCCAGFTDADANTLKLNPDGGAAELAARELKAKYIGDITLVDGMRGLALDTRSIMAVPVNYTGSLLGVLNVESPQKGAFSEDDQEIVAISANHLAPILSNLSCAEKNAQQIESQKHLYEITNKIRQSTNMDTILRIFTEEICSELNLRKATVRVNSDFLTSTEALMEKRT